MGLLCLKLVPETVKNTPYSDLYSVVCFNMAKTMTYWLLSILKPTPPHKDVLSTPRDHESHNWGQWGHHQIPETIRNIPYSLVFTLVWFWYVKIMFLRP